MELFKYRNVALGCGCFLVLLFASFYFNTAARIAILVFACVAILLLSLLIWRIRTYRMVDFAGKLIPALMLCAVAMVLSLVSFDKSHLLSLDESREYSVDATVTDCQYYDSYFGIYEANLSRVNEESFDESIILFAYGHPLEAGTVISAAGAFTHLTSAEDKSYNLSRGIVSSFEVQEYTITGKESFPVRTFLKNANSFLASTLEGLDDSTEPLISALILGNRQGLDPQMKRDFAKIGLSHILALSGMHIGIIVTLLSIILGRLKLRKGQRDALLIFATLLFVGITGFSESAVRAGFMVILSILFSFFGTRSNTVSTLFYSVTLVCIIDPYSIFSVSLLLSFFAMLGCTVAEQIVILTFLEEKIKNGVLRYIIISLMTTTVVLVFTMPVVYMVFGYISYLSPITNLLFSPVFTLLIYISPIYMATSWIPIVKDIIGWIIEKISAIITVTSEWIASLDGIAVSVTGYVQIIGALITIFFALAFLVCRRRLALKMVRGAACGILVLIIGTGIMLHDRSTSVYAGAISNGEGDDVVFLEDTGELTIFQIGSSRSLCYHAMQQLGYYFELDNLVLTDYNQSTYSTLLFISNVSYLKNVYLPSPADDQEQGAYNQVAALAKERGIEIYTTNELKGTKSTEIKFSESAHVGYSDVRVVAFSITSKSTKLTYLGNGANHLYNEFSLNEPYLSDVLMIGTAGPERKAQYYYDTGDYLDLCVYLGNSQEYAHPDFSKRVMECATTDKTELPRIKFPD